MRNFALFSLACATTALLWAPPAYPKEIKDQLQSVSVSVDEDGNVTVDDNSAGSKKPAKIQRPPARAKTAPANEPAPDNRQEGEIKIQDRNPLEPRDLIEKYENTRPKSQKTETEETPIQDRATLEPRNLVDKYNKIGEPEPGNEKDIDLMKEDPLKQGDLIEKYDKLWEDDTEDAPADNPARSDSSGFKHSSWEMGTELFEYQYREPSFMKLKGNTFGLFGIYTYRLSENSRINSLGDIFKEGNGINVFKLDGRASWGILDYESEGTGTNDDENHYTLEFRGLAGYDLPFSESFTLTPYTGLGIRYLYDDSGGHQTTTGHYTYDRESRYIYFPIGFETVKNFRQGWSAGLTLEYDYFIDGLQKSHMEDVSRGYSTLENDQNDGWGWRGSLKIAKSLSNVSLFVEPFYRYWHIEDSEISAITYSGVAVGYGLEPNNNTNEYGVKLGVQF